MKSATEFLKLYSRKRLPLKKAYTSIQIIVHKHQKLMSWIHIKKQFICAPVYCHVNLYPPRKKMPSIFRPIKFPANIPRSVWWPIQNV